MDPTVPSLNRAGLITEYGVVALRNRLWAELCKSHVKELVLREMLLLPRPGNYPVTWEAAWKAPAPVSKLPLPQLNTAKNMPGVTSLSFSPDSNSSLAWMQLMEGLEILETNCKGTREAFCLFYLFNSLGSAVY